MNAVENLKRNVPRRRRNQSTPKNVAVRALKTRSVNTKINPRTVHTKINPRNVIVRHKQKNAKMLPQLEVGRNATVNAKRERPKQEFQDQQTPL